MEKLEATRNPQLVETNLRHVKEAVFNFGSNTTTTDRNIRQLENLLQIQAPAFESAELAEPSPAELLLVALYERLGVLSNQQNKTTVEQLQRQLMDLPPPITLAQLRPFQEQVAALETP